MYLVANWKMNLTLPEAITYAGTLNNRVEPDEKTEVILAASFPFLTELKNTVDSAKIKISSQTLSAPDFGAFTGDVCAAQLAGIVDYAIIGHSERRLYFHETDEDIAEKISFALAHNITPIICVGETAEERNAGKTEEVLRTQIKSALDSVDTSRVLLAYEPVWAISTMPGATPATPEEIIKTTDTIIDILTEVVGTELPPLLYGGSVNPDNIGPYLEIPAYTGFLIGGASLDIEKMCAMIEVAKKVSK